MRSAVSVSELFQRLASFARDRRGISAVEFAMVLPLMVTLYLGVIEVSQGIGIDRRLRFRLQQFFDGGVVALGEARFEFVAGGAKSRAPHQMGHQGNVVTVSHGHKSPYVRRAKVEQRMSLPSRARQANGRAEIRGLSRRSLRRSMPVPECVLHPGPPRASKLRRALHRPATHCGQRRG